MTLPEYIRRNFKKYNFVILQKIVLDTVDSNLVLLTSATVFRTFFKCIPKILCIKLSNTYKLNINDVIIKINFQLRLMRPRSELFRIICYFFGGFYHLVQFLNLLSFPIKCGYFYIMLHYFCICFFF